MKIKWHNRMKFIVVILIFEFKYCKVWGKYKVRKLRKCKVRKLRVAIIINS